jgi:hypothetical protein
MTVHAYETLKTGVLSSYLASLASSDLDAGRCGRCSGHGGLRRTLQSAVQRLRRLATSLELLAAVEVVVPGGPGLVVGCTGSGRVRRAPGVQPLFRR